MIRTPSNLEVLLHCHYSSEAHPRIDAPAVADGLGYLMANKMIEYGPGPNVYSTTEKGRAYISHLMQIPFPVPVWTIPTEKPPE